MDVSGIPSNGGMVGHRLCVTTNIQYISTFSRNGKKLFSHAVCFKVIYCFFLFTRNWFMELAGGVGVGGGVSKQMTSLNNVKSAILN